jgi:hypothetical protein
MSKSISQNPNGSRRPGATGPRTPEGKRRSAQNASTHKIFAGRMFSEEQKEASKLYSRFREDLQPQSSLEIELIGDLVQNRLQARRIDKYWVHESSNAQLSALFEDFRRLDARYELFRPTVPVAAPEDGKRRPFHPMYCLWGLITLRETIKEHGARPDRDLAVLNAIYGGELTAAATEMVRLYKLLKLAQAGNQGGEGTTDCASLQARILELLDREIDWQRYRLSLEQVRDKFEIGTNPELPPEPVLRRIERYRSGNLRQLMRLMDAIKKIRGLQ